MALAILQQERMPLNLAVAVLPKANKPRNEIDNILLITSNYHGENQRGLGDETGWPNWLPGLRHHPSANAQTLPRCCFLWCKLSAAKPYNFSNFLHQKIWKPRVEDSTFVRNSWWAKWKFMESWNRWHVQKSEITDLICLLLIFQSSSRQPNGEFQWAQLRKFATEHRTSFWQRFCLRRFFRVRFWRFSFPSSFFDLTRCLSAFISSHKHMTNEKDIKYSYPYLPTTNTCQHQHTCT